MGGAGTGRLCRESICTLRPPMKTVGPYKLWGKQPIFAGTVRVQVPWDLEMPYNSDARNKSVIGDIW